MLVAWQPSGKAEVCKTFIRGFDSRSGLQYDNFRSIDCYRCEQVVPACRQGFPLGPPTLLFYLPPIERSSVRRIFLCGQARICHIITSIIFQHKYQKRGYLDNLVYIVDQVIHKLLFIRFDIIYSVLVITLILAKGNHCHQFLTTNKLVGNIHINTQKKFVLLHYRLTSEVIYQH